jgi:large-conductance mechanosensitive channel
MNQLPLKLVDEQVSTLRESLKKFVNNGNLIPTMTGITIGTAFLALMRSLVNDVTFPFVYLCLKLKSEEFSALDVGKLVKFLKELMTFSVVLIVTYLFVEFILKRTLNLEEAVKESKAAPAPAPAVVTAPTAVAPIGKEKPSSPQTRSLGGSPAGPESFESSSSSSSYSVY